MWHMSRFGAAVLIAGATLLSGCEQPAPSTPASAPVARPETATRSQASYKAEAYYTRVQRSLLTLYLGHVTIQLPYTILVVGARFAGTDPSLEEAATSLGAKPWRTFWRVTFPLVLPGIMAAALFAFTVSFDNFVISYFLAPPGVSTLPVEIYSAIRKGFTPEINAVSTIVFFISATSVLLVGREISFA